MINILGKLRIYFSTLAYEIYRILTTFLIIVTTKIKYTFVRSNN